MDTKYAAGSAMPIDLPHSTQVDRTPVKQKVDSAMQADETRAQAQFHRRVSENARADLSRVETNPKVVYPLR